MSFKNDRLVINEDRKSIKVNIPLDMESTGTQKILQKEKINGILINYDYVCLHRGQNNLYATNEGKPNIS
jgi:hypothetical protein